MPESFKTRLARWGFNLFQLTVMLFVPIWLARKRKEGRPFVRFRLKLLFVESAVAIPVALGVLVFMFGANHLWQFARHDDGFQWMTWTSAAKSAAPATCSTSSLSTRARSSMAWPLAERSRAGAGAQHGDG